MSNDRTPQEVQIVVLTHEGQIRDALNILAEISDANGQIHADVALTLAEKAATSKRIKLPKRKGRPPHDIDELARRALDGARLIRGESIQRVYDKRTEERLIREAKDMFGENLELLWGAEPPLTARKSNKKA